MNYSKCIGGENSCNKEVYEKINRSKLGHTVSIETRKKISKANKGTTGHITGKTQTSEIKNKISLAQAVISRGKRLYKDGGSWTIIKVGE